MWRARVDPLRYAVHCLAIVQSVQHILPYPRAVERRNHGIAGPLAPAQILNLAAEIFLGLANR